MSSEDNEDGAQADGLRTATQPAEIEAGSGLDFSLIDIPGLILFWGLAVIVFLQFFTRYVLNNSLAWTEEIARYVLILVAFGGAMTVTRKGTAIFLEFFYRYISPMAGKYLSIIVEIMTTGFYTYLVWLGIELSLKTRTKMASAPIPKSLVYWGVTAFLAVMAIYSLVWVIRKWRKTPDEIIKHIEDQVVTD